MVVIIDYGVGNLGSLQNMFRKIGIPHLITSDLKKVLEAKKILLPGVGAFDAAMKKLNQTGMASILKEKINQGTFIMGICLGAQILTMSSEEGDEPGLGALPAKCIKFDVKQADIKVPHMGWSGVTKQRNHPILDFSDHDRNFRFYFAHSYHFITNQSSIIVGNSVYGYEFPAVIGSNNILAVQFHPEKSHRFGMKLLENFAFWGDV